MADFGTGLFRGAAVFVVAEVFGAAVTRGVVRFFAAAIGVDPAAGFAVGVGWAAVLGAAAFREAAARGETAGWAS